MEKAKKQSSHAYVYKRKFQTSTRVESQYQDFVILLRALHISKHAYGSERNIAMRQFYLFIRCSLHHVVDPDIDFENNRATTSECFTTTVLIGGET